MKFETRIKFNCSVSAQGDITIGSAVPGFLAGDFTSQTYNVFHILLENAANGGWVTAIYDADAAAGTRFTFVDAGTTSISFPQASLVCSFIAPPSSLVVGSYRGTPKSATVSSLNSVALGNRGAVGNNAPNSLAVVGAVNDGAQAGVAVGEGATVGAPQGIAIGVNAEVQDQTDFQTFNTISNQGAMAIGHRAKSTTGGEVVLGNSGMAHMSGVPIATGDVSAGGTFTFKAVAGFDGNLYQPILTEIMSTNQAFVPQNTERLSGWVIHIQGVIVARADVAANNKTVKVEWVTGGTLTQTTLTNGANDISLGLAMNAGRLETTVAAIAGLRLEGYLHITKIPN